MDIDTKQLHELAEPFRAAGKAIANYVEALKDHAKLDEIATHLGSDCYVLQTYLDGHADDNVLKLIDEMAEEERLGEDDGELMDFHAAERLLAEREEEQSANESGLKDAEGAVDRTRRAARLELRAALSCARRETRGEGNPTGANIYGDTFAQIREILSPCLKQQKQFSRLMREHKVTKALEIMAKAILKPNEK